MNPSLLADPTLTKEKWNALMKCAAKDYSFSLVNDNTLKLLLHKKSQEIRSTSSGLIEKLLTVLPNTREATAHEMIKALPSVFSLPAQTIESFMNLFKNCLSKGKSSTPEEKARINNTGTTILKISQKYFEELVSQHTTPSLKRETTEESFWLGYPFKTCINILLDLATNHGLFSSSESGIIPLILSFYLRSKKLLPCINSHVDEGTKKLQTLFNLIPRGTLDEKKLLLSYCLDALAEAQDDYPTVLQLYEIIQKVLHTTSTDNKYQIIFVKAESQEEFISGNLDMSTYTLEEVGTTMKEARKKICKDLGTPDLEGVFELLIDDKIVDLSTPLKVAYEKIWWPLYQKKKNPGLTAIPPLSEVKQADLKPMEITFRLAGIEGEGSELQPNKAETWKISTAEAGDLNISVAFEENPPAHEEKSRKRAGIQILLGHLQEFSTKKDIVEVILKILETLSQSSSLQRLLLDMQVIFLFVSMICDAIIIAKDRQSDIISSLVNLIELLAKELYNSSTGARIIKGVEPSAYVKKIIDVFYWKYDQTISSKENNISKNCILIFIRFAKVHLNFREIDPIHCNWKQRSSSPIVIIL